MILLARIFLIPLFLVGISYSGFKAYQYVQGNSYISYLKDHKASFSLDNEWNFEMMSDDIASHKLIIVGENHGFEEPQQFDPQFFSYLNRNHGIKTYLLEMDMAQAYFMNRYNETGDDNLLRRILKKWVVNAGKNNKDYFQRWKKLGEYYRSGHEFRYLGVNSISDVELLFDYTAAIDSSLSITYNTEIGDSLNMINLKNQLSDRINAFSQEDSVNDPSFELSHLALNVDDWLNDRYREEVLTRNAAAYYNEYDLNEEKVYGFFGIGHSILAPLEGGYQSMACRLRQEYPPLEDNILAINFLYQDSYTVAKTANLPSILQDEGTYTRLAVSYDDMLIGYLVGIEDLKRVTKPGTNTIFKMDAKDSPYNNSNRLFKMFSIMPTPKMNSKDSIPTANYGQYVILCRNSDWAEPWSEESQKYE